MVKRKSLTLAQAKRSLRAFYGQKAGKRRGCGSEHKRRSKKRSNKKGGGAAHKKKSKKRNSKRNSKRKNSNRK